MAGKDRIQELLKPGASLNGLDFVEIREAEPQRVYLHFVNGMAVHAAGMAASIRGGDTVPTVPVEPIAPGDWSADAEGRRMLALKVPGRGDFSIYRLELSGGQRLDPHLSGIEFSFFAFCVSPIDCAAPSPPSPRDAGETPPIDYLAKDYASFRAALLEFSALRYPEWRERSETDFGMVMLEALSAIGDELSYLQDEGHRQPRLETMTSRRAAARLARLVDYDPAPLTSASTWLDLDVSGTTVPAGTLVSAFSADGSEVPFEIGTGLADRTVYEVRAGWHELKPYWWDDSESCLQPGATAMCLEGHGHGLKGGQPLLLDTENGSRQLVRLVRSRPGLPEAGEELFDPLFGNTPITRISWEPGDALRAAHQLSETRVSANLVPATQGQRYEETFAIGPVAPGSPPVPLALARLAANADAEHDEWTYLHSLRNARLTCLRGADGRAVPEIALDQLGDRARPWSWVRRLLDAGRGEPRFATEPGSYRAVAQLTDGVFWDSDADDGTLIRFGGGDFGALPEDGDRFRVSYRTSRGAAGNVAADTITSVAPLSAGFIVAASNPFAATGGAEAESIAEIRRSAPYAFQASTFRAVRPEDFDVAARQLPFVQRAGTAFRWTGTWPTIFSSIDARGAASISPSENLDLISLLNRYRLAGYEIYSPPTRYISFDLSIVVCANADAYPGDVYAGIDAALRPALRADGTPGFFHFDNFTLGSPFERSRLEAAIQNAPGVAGVLSISYRRRGSMSAFVELPMRVPLGAGEIFRLDNYNNHPERGSYRLEVRGGR